MTLGGINTVALSLSEAKLAEGQRCLTAKRSISEAPFDKLRATILSKVIRL
jgi:hypothetical protein